MHLFMYGQYDIVVCLVSLMQPCISQSSAHKLVTSEAGSHSDKSIVYYWSINAFHGDM